GWAAGGEAAPAASVERRRCRAAPGTHVVLDTGVPGKADSLRLFSNGRLRPASQRRAVLPASIAPVPGPTDAGRRDGIFSFHRHGRRRGGAHGTPIPSVVVGGLRGAAGPVPVHAARERGAPASHMAAAARGLPGA